MSIPFVGLNPGSRSVKFNVFPADVMVRLVEGLANTTEFSEPVALDPPTPSSVKVTAPSPAASAIVRLAGVPPRVMVFGSMPVN